KQTTPTGDPTSFAFTGDIAGSAVDGGSLTASVGPGSYSTTESLPTGWTLTAISCDAAASGDVPTAKASYTIGAGQAGTTVNCTFKDFKNATIKLTKQTTPTGDPTSFAFTGDIAGSAVDGGSLTASVGPGSYSTTESVPTGWTLTAISCDTAASGDVPT